MPFAFTPAVQALIDNGTYEIVKTATGNTIGLARDSVTKKFVAHAIGFSNNGLSFNPMVSSLQPILGATQMYQTHQGFQATLQGINAIQSSLGVLQATTAVIGIGTAVGVGLSAVNLWQTLKLRKDLKQLKLDIRDGFLDLKTALRHQGKEVIEHIDKVAQDTKFEQHRLELIKAYGRFIEATKIIKTATQFQDIDNRKIELANARQTLGEALANYNNPDLLSETCAAGQLRRLECAWAIEQTIIMTYQLQNEPTAVSDRLIDLHNKIRQHCLNVIDKCESEEELAFLYPEITCIHDRDLIVLSAWQDRVDWLRSLSPSELSQLKSLANSEIAEAEFVEEDKNNSSLEKPYEIELYEDLQAISHYNSLIDELKLKLSSDLRKEYEQYVSDRAKESGHKVLNQDNLSTASELTIANLYWYFQVRDEFNEELENTTNAA